MPWKKRSGFLRVMFTALTLALILSAAVAWAWPAASCANWARNPTLWRRWHARWPKAICSPWLVRRVLESDSVLASLGAMQTSLAQVVDKVRDASNAVTQGADEIAAGNAGLLQRTEEQASNLQRAAASMEEMTSSVKNNADTARQAAQLAASASDAAHKGGEVVTQVVHTMEDISSQQLPNCRHYWRD